MPPPTALRFRPRLTLHTLTRGEGLLGLRATPGFGPRGAQLTVARVDWTYAVADSGADTATPWTTPAPTTVLNTTPWPLPPHRNLAAEAQARDELWATALRPLPTSAFQWRTPPVSSACSRF